MKKGTGKRKRDKKRTLSWLKSCLAVAEEDEVAPGSCYSKVCSELALGQWERGGTSDSFLSVKNIEDLRPSHLLLFTPSLRCSGTFMKEEKGFIKVNTYNNTYKDKERSNTVLTNIKYTVSHLSWDSPLHHAVWLW